ncbi:MAG: hypothetical protein FJ241_11830 [Nitrospira sp.]|nr:hypothetical protein [Nitrospira sp.]
MGRKEKLDYFRKLRDRCREQGICTTCHNEKAKKDKVKCNTCEQEMRRYYNENKEKFLKLYKKWRLTHPKYFRKWLENHPYYYKKWLKLHPNYFRNYKRRRNDRNMGSEIQG